jgi:hypothetical protein
VRAPDVPLHGGAAYPGGTPCGTDAGAGAWDARAGGACDARWGAGCGDLTCGGAVAITLAAIGETGCGGSSTRGGSSPNTVFANGSVTSLCACVGATPLDTFPVGATGAPQVAQKRALAMRVAPHLVQLAMESVSHERS